MKNLDDGKRDVKLFSMVTGARIAVVDKKMYYPKCKVLVFNLKSLYYFITFCVKTKLPPVYFIFIFSCSKWMKSKIIYNPKSNWGYYLKNNIWRNVTWKK